MWPMLLNMTRDDCRRTLRSLELEAYSNMITVFRAQGPLEESRKRLLEELRGVLHISNDRHSAEARRVANDEILATIAEQLVGPNSGQAWACEGRRRVPLMPRGIPQTLYTEIADKVAEASAAENKEILRKLEAEKLVASKTTEEEISEADGNLTEDTLSTDDAMDETLYPPIVMEDQTLKLWETELLARKRKVPESCTIPEDTATPIKNCRNITVNTNQKHLNIPQLYSKASQPASKPSGHSKHSYNQVSKVSTSKSNQRQPSRRGVNKNRTQKNARNTTRETVSKSQKNKSQNPHSASHSNQYSPLSLQMEYGAPPGSFQASYAQSLMGHQTKHDYIENMKPKGLSSSSMMSDSPTMQLLTQPATVPHELGVSDGAHAEDPTTLQAKATPVPKSISGKPCQLILKRKSDGTGDPKIEMSDLKILQKPTEGIKLLSNRPMILTPSSTQKVLNTSKFVTTKILGTIPKSSKSTSTVLTDKMIVVSKPPENKAIPNSKLIVSSITSNPTNCAPTTVTNVNASKPPEAIVAKGIPATDIKVSAKTILLNPKSGQKMVVLPGNPKNKSSIDGQPMPLFHFKGVPTTMKLVSVGSQCNSPVVKPSSVTVMAKPNILTHSTPSSKIIGMEPIKTANMADIVPVKGLTPVSTIQKSNPIIRPTVGKGSVIVVQKGATIGKTLSFTKNGNDMSKIIMGKNVNQLLQASNAHKQEGKGSANNVIVLELNNDQSARATTISEILESRNSVPPVCEDVKVSHEGITEDTPVLFENQIVDDPSCNTNSLDSAPGSIDIGTIVDRDLLVEKTAGGKSEFSKDSECTKDTSSVTDWEMELDTVSRKGKDDDDKLNSLHLDLGMSSDSETDYMVDRHKSKINHLPEDSIQRSTPSGENSEIFTSSASLTHAGRTLLSQLQDEGSSSNDSSFALNKNKLGIDKLKGIHSKLDVVVDKSESEALNKAKEKLKEKVAEAKSQQKRIDIFSTAITTSDINLDSFSYLDESMMVEDEMFANDTDSKRDLAKDAASLDIQLSHLLSESTNSSDVPSVSESLSLNK